MSKKSLISSFVWGIAASMISVIVSAAIALLFPPEIHFASDSSPPKVGQVYTREEIDAREQLARKRLEEVRADLAKRGVVREIANDMTDSLPFIVFAVLTLVVGIKRMSSLSSLFLIALPSVLVIVTTRAGS